MSRLEIGLIVIATAAVAWNGAQLVLRAMARRRANRKVETRLMATAVGYARWYVDRGVDPRTACHAAGQVYRLNPEAIADALMQQTKTNPPTRTQ